MLKKINIASWQRLSGKQKKFLIIVGLISLVVLLVMLFSGDKNNEGRKNRDVVIKSVLTDQSTRSTSMDALYARVRKFENDVISTNKRLANIEGAFEKYKTDNSVQQKEILNSLNALKLEITKLQKNSHMWEKNDNNQVKDKKDAAEKDTDSLSSKSSKPDLTPSEDKSQSKVEEENYFSNAPIPPVTTTTKDRNGVVTKKPNVKLNNYTEYKTVEEEEKEEEGTIYLPAGSILTGSFINGLDAPTAQGANKDPFPTLMRIQKDAILPNQYSLDIKECFLIMSGYGELSSERVFLRGETLSCIRNDGGVIETPLNSYAVGEDGKAGVRGRLVSREGQLLAKTLMAGFLSGMSHAFDVNPIPVISTDNIGSTAKYQSNYSSDAFQGAAAKGASKALEKVADYYLNMADMIFPVIELDAGRQVDVIVSKGINLKLKAFNK